MQVLVSRGLVVLPIWHIFRFPPYTMYLPPFSEQIACSKREKKRMKTEEKAARRRTKTKKKGQRWGQKTSGRGHGSGGCRADRWLVRIHVIAVNCGRAGNTHASGVDTSQCTRLVGVRRREETSSQSLKDLPRPWEELGISPLWHHGGTVKPPLAGEERWPQPLRLTSGPLPNTWKVQLILYFSGKQEPGVQICFWRFFLEIRNLIPFWSTVQKQVAYYRIFNDLMIVFCCTLDKVTYKKQHHASLTFATALGKTLQRW